MKINYYICYHKNDKTMKTLNTLILVLFMSTISFGAFSQTQQKETTPTPAQVSYEKGVKLQKEYKYSEAIKCFDEAIKADSNMASAYYYRAYCKCNLGLKAEACPDLKKASELGHYVEKVAIPCDCDAKDPNKTK
jgi:tetratricopeptide (TPR) repeat protein